MSQRTFSVKLPTINQYGTNMFDQVSGLLGYPIAPNWSPGAQLVVGEPFDQGPQAPFTVLGYGFAFQGVTLNIQSLLNSQLLPCFANLGKLYGGLMKNSGLAVRESSFIGLPSDQSMIELLWNGQSDPPWPQLINSNPPQMSGQNMLVFKESLAQPVDFAEGDVLTIGLWLTPMLGQNVGVWVMNGAYTIVYDDHK